MAEQRYSTLVVNEGAQKKDAPSGPTWERLFKQRHESYDPELWKKLRLLHEGGYAIQKNADLFIDKAPNEPDSYYRWRIKTTAYVNHMSRVVGHIVGGLFGAPLKVSVDEEGSKKRTGKRPNESFYELFALDCDLQGTDFSQFMQRASEDALVLRRTLIGVDMPPGVEASNLAQEEAMGGGRAWLYDIPLESMLDWEVDDRGQYKWCKLVKKVQDRADPLGDHSSYVYEFKIWRLGPASGNEGAAQVATFEVYRSKVVTAESDMKPEDVLEMVTPPTPTSFLQIPIVELAIPAAIWAGNQCGPLCTEHYNGRSDLRGSMCRNLVEIPYVKRGSEIPAVHGALPSLTQQDPNRGEDPVAQAKAKGFVAIGADDEIGFAGPSGSAYSMAAEELGRVRDEIYSALNTMALALANTASTVQRSGESKREDRSATGIILDYLADRWREGAQKVYDRVSDGRGEDGAAWKASGIDSFDDEDGAAIITEATEISMLTIPSKTFHVEHAKKVAFVALPKASNSVKEQISKELEANITDESVLPVREDPAETLAKDRAKGGGAGNVPGGGGPKPKPNAAGGKA